MSNEWHQTTLGELCSKGHAMMQTGPFGSQLHSYDYVQEGIRVVPTEAITRGRLELANVPRVTDGKAKELARHFLIEGDILFARRGIQATGLAAMVRKEDAGSLCGTGAILLRLSGDAVFPPFLNWFLAYEETNDWLRQNAVGAVMPNLNASVLQRLPITLPPLPEQRAIARVLGGLDDKIEVNREQNRVLEAMAGALFRSWFVDFDPVVAKAEGRRSRAEICRAFRLPESAFDAIPAAFFDSPLGPVPKGWEVTDVTRIARYVNGRAFTKDATGTGRLVIRIAELNSGIGGSSVYNDLKADAENVAFQDDILFSWSGSLGIYRWHGEESLINQHIFKVICGEYPKWFVYFQLLEALPAWQDIAADKATTMGHIKRCHLEEARFSLPPLPLLLAVDPVIRPLYEAIHHNAEESRALAALRDTLLPKLLSGEVRVSGARD